MKFIDIIKDEKMLMDLIGQDIEITGLNDYFEGHFNVGMRGEVVSCRYYERGEEDEYVAIEIDFSKFKYYNNSKMTNNFYDSEGVPRLKWSETPFYGDGKDSIYLMTQPNKQNEQSHLDTFKFVNIESRILYNLYKDADYNGDYINFLEKLAYKALKAENNN